MNTACAPRSMADFQQRFARALMADSPELDELTRQPGFAVYRNTVLKGCMDALQAQFPSIVKLTGAAWFDDAAAIYARQQPPQAGPLLLYGEKFPEFLTTYAPAQALPYLPAVARLDRLWSESHVAADAPVLGAGDLARLASHEQALATLRLQSHPAARWLWDDALPAYTLWSRTRADEDPGRDLLWQGEGALLTRPADRVVWHPASRAACAFLDACAAGHPLPEALAHALQAEPDANPSALLATLAQAGALTLNATQVQTT